MAQPAVQPVAQPALEIPVDLLDPCPFQTRIFPKDDPALAELAASIGKLGVLQDLIARPHPEDDGRFELASGERRWRAAQLAKLDAVPVKVLDLDDAALAEICAVENLQREQLHPLEEADAIRLLVDRAGWDHAAVADQLGKSLGFVGRRARLANLSPAWREAITASEHPASRWSASHLSLIARLEAAEQNRLLKTKLSAHWWWMASAANLRSHIANLTQQLGRAPFSTISPTLVPEAGPCVTCPKRSSHHPGLFDDEEDGAPLKSGDERIPPGDRCLDPACWRKKLNAYVEQRETTLRQRFDGLILLALQDRSGARFRHNYKKVKKGAKGAVPALYVDGANAGEFSWVVRLFKARTTAARRTQRQVARRRRRALSDSLLERVQEVPAPKIHVVAAWALAHRRPYAYHSEPGLGLAKQWTDAEELLKLPRAQLYERLWKVIVLPTLTARLQDIAQDRDLEATVPTTSDDDGPTITVRELLMNELDHIFQGSLDLAALEAEIADNVREPNTAQAALAA